MIFGVWNPGEIWHENLTYCPPCVSDVTTVPWKIPKKSFSTVLFTHTSDYLRYLTRQQSVIHLPTPPENVTTLTWELQNFSSDWRFVTFFQAVDERHGQRVVDVCEMRVDMHHSGQRTFQLACCRERSAVMATGRLQPQDPACGTLFRLRNPEIT